MSGVRVPDWSPAAVTLLQGVLYASDERAWNLLLSNRSAVEDYFEAVALRLVVEESAPGMAYLRQLETAELDPEGPAVPRLLRTAPMTYAQTLLCVLLRDEYRRFEDDPGRDERCVVEEPPLLDRWAAFFPPPKRAAAADEKKLRKDLRAALAKLAEFGFVRKLKSEEPRYEVLPVLKARLPVDALAELRDTLRAHPGGRPPEDAEDA